jgi:hypothetical protein
MPYKDVLDARQSSISLYGIVVKLEVQAKEIVAWLIIETI